MKLHLLDIPDDAEALAEWLEDRLLGPDLGEVIAEFFAIYDAEEDGATLDQVLHGRTSRVLEQGLHDLPPAMLGALLRRPKLLLELQRRALSEGGGVWRRRPIDPRVHEAANRGRRLLDAWLEAPTELNDAPRMAPPRSRPDRPNTGFWRQTLTASLASAACAVLAVFVLEMFLAGDEPRAVSQSPAAAAAGWGWMQDESLSGADTASGHLLQLAGAAEEWFHRRPDTAPAVGRRIGEFRQGCTQLILAEHDPLAEADRAWLRERCRAWAGELDANLSALESGADPQAVLAEADETVTRLIGALRARADGLADSPPAHKS
ncbi:MAG: hypothetical protein KY475_12375 [Planctomycetes bacterium]|nr:hypothetical protein [Planctomycetota bacterium]